MNRGGIILCGSAVLAVAACAGEQGKLEIRAKATPLAQGERPVPFRIAEARGQLALGNVGLALESYRKALRDEPASADALAGIADCYDRMGRFDLSRRHYEAALAVAPTDPQLLGALAQSLDRQGLGEEAGAIRIEIAQRLAAAASPAAVNVPAPVGTATTVQEAALADAGPPVEQLPAPTFRPAEVSLALADVSFVPSNPQVDSAIAPLPAEPAPPPLEVANAVPARSETGRSVTVKLPPPRPMAEPVEAAEAGKAVETQVEAIAIEQVTRRRAAEREVAERRETRRNGPRLVRLSMGEIALVTADGPRWRVEPVSQTALSATVRFVPIRPTTAIAEVRLLNAARVHRLAARTRAYLRGHGWRSVAIGDADSTRAKSIIFYPVDQQSLARRLSKQFGFAMARREEMEQVTVMLGRDSIRIAGVRAGA